MTTNKFDISKALFFLVGICLAILYFFLPIKVIVLLVGGLAAVIVTIFYFELSFSMFIFIMFMAPHALWNNLFMLIAAIFYLAIYYLQVLQGKREGISFKYIGLSFLFFVLISTLSVFLSHDIKDSLRVYIIMLSSIILGIITMSIIKSKQTLNLVLNFIVLSLLVVSIYGIYQKFSGVATSLEFIDVNSNVGMPGRVFSTMDNPNNFAEYLIMVLPLCFTMILNSKNEFKKLILIFISLLGVYILIYTLSRSSYIAFAIGAFFYILLINMRLIPFAAILLIALVPFTPNFLIQRMSTIGKDTSSQYRFIIWDGVYNILKKFWVQGIGIGPATFKKVYDILGNPRATRVMHSHNLILHIWVEMGIVGLLSLLGTIFSSLKNSFVAYLKTTDKYYKNLFAAYIFSIISITVMGAVEYVWYYPRVMLCYWIILGLAFGTIQLSRSEQ